LVRTRSTSVGLDDRDAIVLHQKWSRGQVEARPANMPPSLAGMEACVGAHHLIQALGYDAGLCQRRQGRQGIAPRWGGRSDFDHAQQCDFCKKGRVIMREQ
jgi:hypothetical protein